MYFHFWKSLSVSLQPPEFLTRIRIFLFHFYTEVKEHAYLCFWIVKYEYGYVILREQEIRFPIKMLEGGEEINGNPKPQKSRVNIF